MAWAPSHGRAARSLVYFPGAGGRVPAWEARWDGAHPAADARFLVHLHQPWVESCSRVEGLAPAGSSSSQWSFTFAIRAGGPKWQSLTDVRRAMRVAAALLGAGTGWEGRGALQTTRNALSLSQCLQSKGLKSCDDEQVTVHRRRGRN